MRPGGRRDVPEALRGLATDIAAVIHAGDGDASARALRRLIAVCSPAEELRWLWACAQRELGDVLMRAPSGDVAEAYDDAIEAYRSALEFFSEQGDPVQWATIQNNLGNGLRERIHGERADNVEDAIRAYADALRVRRRDTRATSKSRV